MNDMM